MTGHFLNSISDIAALPIKMPQFGNDPFILIPQNHFDPYAGLHLSSSGKRYPGLTRAVFLHFGNTQLGRERTLCFLLVPLAKVFFKYGFNRVS